MKKVLCNFRIKENKKIDYKTICSEVSQIYLRFHFFSVFVTNVYVFWKYFKFVNKNRKMNMEFIHI